MTNDLLEDILKVLRDRDIQYDRDAIKSALNDPESQTAIREWVEEYLSPETLLTKDEAALYAALSKSGELDKLASKDLSSVQGLNDAEIQEAIEELKRSTSAIEKHSEALRLQQNAMAALVKSGQRASESRARTNASQLKKWDMEAGHINKRIEDLASSLMFQSADLEQQSKVSETSLKQTVDGILRSDDKLLGSLQKLASDLDPIKSDDDTMISRIRELCARLIKHTVEGIRTKLDRIYLEALKSSPASKEAENQETKDLQEELESLYSEILPVAQMSAEQQFLQPALKAIEATDGRGQERAAKAIKYIHECLTFLVTRLETYLARAQDAQGHKLVLQHILESARAELSQLSMAPTSPTATKSSTRARRKSSSTSRSPTATRTPATRRRSSGGDAEDLDPSQQIARALGITLPPDSASDAVRGEILDKTLSDRLSKFDIHSASLQSTTEASISSHIEDARSALQLLQDALLADTMYKKVRLLDADIEASVGMFEAEITELQDALEGVDLTALGARNVKREGIVERWGR